MHLFRFLPLILLVGSNCFMTYAWYGHLKDLRSQPFWVVILASWGIAFFEYCLQVPANRIGFSDGFTLVQLKVLQEVIAMGVFAAFAFVY
ncbi:MAG: DMT family protein, partial [Planctomycetia bacterium]|nr:DMT family protein [Planctomycetia bacterium]